MIEAKAQTGGTDGVFARGIAFSFSTLGYRNVIWALAVRNFQKRFIGTGVGAAWSVIHRLATVLIFWLVFSLGFKAQGPQGIPFVVYFMTGFLPWIFMRESLSASVNTVVANPHLVKKWCFLPRPCRSWRFSRRAFSRAAGR